VEHTIIQKTESLQSFLPSDGIRVVRSGVKPHAIKGTILLYIPLHTPSYTLLKQILLSFTVLLQDAYFVRCEGRTVHLSWARGRFLVLQAFLVCFIDRGPRLH
jgi:hypothetical protein